MTQLILLIDIAPELAIVGDPPDARVGMPYTHPFTAVEGTAALQWAIVDSALPAGWSLHASTGVLTHPDPVPDSPPIAFTVRCRDALLVESTRDCVIRVGYPLDAPEEKV